MVKIYYKEHELELHDYHCKQEIIFLETSYLHLNNTIHINNATIILFFLLRVDSSYIKLIFLMNLNHVHYKNIIQTCSKDFFFVDGL